MKFALCNEVLQPLGFEQQCAFAAKLGYDGLEVAPFTLAGNPMDITDTQALAFRRIAEDAGLKICGLHWLLVAPAGLSISSEDQALRMRTLGVMIRLVELCTLLGGRYLVHGSPKQRSTPGGSTKEQALARVTDIFARIAPVAQQHGVTYCIEPLSTRETDVINTVAEAAAIVDEVNSPALKTMIDCSAAGPMEQETIPVLIERWMPSGHVAHVQVNDPNRRAPGQGDMRFGPILEAIERMRRQGRYDGIVAVEPFDYVPDGPGCAAWSIGYLKGIREGVRE
ncbi:MAG TPA: sugar phosphate isomerase/epimerase family protein [Ramlibacter sp.]|jgi:sugar phosphate isomerase/epimerase